MAMVAHVIGVSLGHNRGKKPPLKLLAHHLFRRQYAHVRLLRSNKKDDQAQIDFTPWLI
jgi:hypothetical protein